MSECDEIAVSIIETRKLSRGFYTWRECENIARDACEDQGATIRDNVAECLFIRLNRKEVTCNSIL